MQIKKLSIHKFLIERLKGVHVSSIVNEAIKANSIFFKKNICSLKKTQNKQKLINKTKTSQY